LLCFRSVEPLNPYRFHTQPEAESPGNSVLVRLLT
jgi:hypothetical protein